MILAIWIVSQVVDACILQMAMSILATGNSQSSNCWLRSHESHIFLPAFGVHFEGKAISFTHQMSPLKASELPDIDTAFHFTMKQTRYPGTARSQGVCVLGCSRRSFQSNVPYFMYSGWGKLNHTCFQNPTVQLGSWGIGRFFYGSRLCFMQWLSLFS